MNIIHFSAFRDADKPEITPGEFTLMATLISHEHPQTGRCTPSVATLLHDTGMCERTLKTSRQKLVARGVITIVRDVKTRAGNGSRYIINADKLSTAWKVINNRGQNLHPIESLERGANFSSKGVQIFPERGANFSSKGVQKLHPEGIEEGKIEGLLKSAPKGQTTPTLEDCLKVAETIGASEEFAKEFFQQMELGGWTTFDGRKIEPRKNLRPIMASAWTKRQNRNRAPNRIGGTPGVYHQEGYVPDWEETGLVYQEADYEMPTVDD